uniref:Coiled-coil domain-containing protein 113-like n=1 Tax=Caenorhabditis tropicalis TaxID=1561998 RepID=A0A1I7TMY4_9PELO
MIENSFQNCFLNLKVADRVEALVSNVLEGQSKLETLKTSYQTGLKSHANTIVHVLFINNEADKSEVLQAHLQNLEEQVEALQELEDVDKIEVAWITLNESYEDFKNDDAKNREKCDKRVEAYQCSIRKRKFIMERVFRAEKELRSCQFKLKKVPYVHFESIADASKTITSSTAKLITMGNQYSQLNDSLKTDLEVSQRQKIVLDKKLSNLLQNTTKIQIELCDVIKKAIRQQIYRHDDLCCLTPEDFDACVR